MLITDYHAHPAIGSTGLRALLRSPAHFRAMDFREPSPAMRFGTLLHTLVLEPETFGERYAVAPGGLDRRRKEDKQIWADFVEASAGREVIDEADHEKANACAQSLLSHRVGAFIKGAKVEQTLMWEDHETGVRCKCRPDVLPGGFLVDVKTAADASPEGFQRSIANYGYHIQAAHYLAGAKANGMDPRGFLFAVVETSPPYAAAGYLLDAESLALGAMKQREALDLYATCVATNEWPGYAGGRIEEIGLPAWALKEMRQ